MFFTYSSLFLFLSVFIFSIIYIKNIILLKSKHKNTLVFRDFIFKCKFLFHSFFFSLLFLLIIPWKYIPFSVHLVFWQYHVCLYVYLFINLIHICYMYSSMAVYSFIFYLVNVFSICFIWLKSHRYHVIFLGFYFFN